MTKQMLKQNRSPKTNPVPSRPVTKDESSHPLHSVTANVSPLRGVGDVANELVSEWAATRIDRLAARIAAHQAEQLAELALTGNPVTPAVLETSLRLAARRVLEDVMDA